jgi:hypothetical protein
MNDSDLYEDIMIYLFFTIIIKKNNINEFITCIADNLINTTYILNKYNLDYFYRIDSNKLNKINLKKYYNNKDYNIFYYNFTTNPIELGTYIYVLYVINNSKIIPIQLFYNFNHISFNNKYNYNHFYIVKLQINKYYKNIYQYEYFQLYQL